MPLGNPRRKNDLLLLASLYLFELSVAVIQTAIWMKGDRSFAAFVSNKPGLVFVSAIGGLVVASVVIITQYVAYKRSASSQFSLIVAMNLVTVMLMIISAEIAIRAASRSSFEGETVGGVVLRPKNWQTVAQETLGKTSHRLLETVFPAPLEKIEEELRRKGFWEGQLIHKRRDGSKVSVLSHWDIQENPSTYDQSITVIEVNDQTAS